MKSRYSINILHSTVCMLNNIKMCLRSYILSHNRNRHSTKKLLHTAINRLMDNSPFTFKCLLKIFEMLMWLVARSLEFSIFCVEESFKIYFGSSNEIVFLRHAIVMPTSILYRLQ